MLKHKLMFNSYMYNVPVVFPETNPQRIRTNSNTQHQMKAFGLFLTCKKCHYYCNTQSISNNVF